MQKKIINFHKVLLVILAVQAILSAGAQSRNMQLPKRGLCAHRGVMDTHPENTLPSLQEAIFLGAQMIEFDIQLTYDSVLVLMHDKSVDRTTNGQGNVADLTFAAIRELDAGSKKSLRFAGTRVPTFVEALAIMPRNIWLNCHLKGGASVGAAAALMLKQSGRLDQAFLTCGEEAAYAAKAAVPGVMICNGENKYRRDGAVYTTATIRMDASFIQFLPAEKGEDRAAHIMALRKKGVRINYYHATLPEEIGPLLDSGIEFILVNNLAAFQGAARAKGIVPVRPQF